MSQPILRFLKPNFIQFIFAQIIFLKKIIKITKKLKKPKKICLGLCPTQNQPNHFELQDLDSPLIGKRSCFKWVGPPRVVVDPQLEPS